MNDPELLRQRRVAETSPDDPKPLYRYRVLALKAGADICPLPGDQVQLLDEHEDEEARVVRVRELAAGAHEVTVRLGDKTLTLSSDDLRIVSPHRPALLLGVDELARRLAEDRDDPHDPRAHETLGEVARRNLKEGIPAAIDLFAHVSEGPDEALRKVLTQVCRSRPFGEVEVELRHRSLKGDERELLELPPLAASAADEYTARDVLDRLERLEGDAAAEAATRCGRNLVGTGGPAFVDADLRQRVATLSREHENGALRVALFLHSVPVLQPLEVLTEKALQSTRPLVRARACEELFRRKQDESVWAHAEKEHDPEVFLAILGAAPSPAPLTLVARCLELGREHLPLEQAALLRLPESKHGEAGVELLSPWLNEQRKTNLDAALWSAGVLGCPTAAAGVLKRLAKLQELERIGTAVEALVRLGHEAGPPALDAWGVQLVRGGAWGEELVDVCGAILGRRVNLRELLGRFLVEPPRHRVRRSRALEAAHALAARGEVEAARPARAWLPCGLARFAELETHLCP